MIEYVYTSRGLISEVKTSSGQHVVYEYDSNGRVTRVLDKANSNEVYSVAYARSKSNNNVVTIKNSQENKQHEIEIDQAIGRITRVTTGSESTTYEYNEKLFITAIKKNNRSSKHI